MVKIRKAVKRDLKEIAEIFRIESTKKPYNQKWTKETSLKNIKNAFEKYEIYIIIEDKIIGFVICKTNKLEKDVRVDELWIKKEYQRKGNGKKLMKFLEGEYKKRGIKNLSLVSDKNSKAFNFYRKLNYIENKSTVFMDKKIK